MKRVECAECGKLVCVPNDIADDGIAVFCSKECQEAEAKAIYVLENTSHEEAKTEGT